MPDERIEDLDERMRILREKADREQIGMADDVLAYIAGKAALPQTLKGALVRVHTMAVVKGAVVDVAFARSVLGTAEELAAEEEKASELEPTPAPEPVPEAAPEPGSATEGESEHLSDEDVLGGELFPAREEPAFLGAAATPYDEEEPAGAGPVPGPPVAEVRPYEPPRAHGPGGATERHAEVWFAPVRTAHKDSLVKRAGRLLERAGLSRVVEEGDLVAVKLHFGESGNTGFVRPVYLREVVARIKAAGGRPFLTDANTLYRGARGNSVDHIACALHNGFSYSTVEAPIIIADGLDGRDAVDVAIRGGRHFEEVRIGSAAVHADALVVVSHFKGHEATGFGGALKNIGMGLGCRSAKQRMHADFRPEVTAGKCTACGRCVQWCPVDAIVIGPDRVAAIDHGACYGCGECVAACPDGAIAAQWKTAPESIQEKIVEHAAGVLAGKEGKAIHLSFLTDISPDCDCWHFSDAGVVADIGVLASTDIVAVDRAAYDLVIAAPGLAGTRGEGLGSGQDKLTAITGVDGTHAIRYAERMGLGTQLYGLRTLD